MREAGRITARALRLVGEAVAPGVTTAELDQIAEEAIREEGAVPAFKGYHGFPATICASLNHEVVHGIPSLSRRLVEGDVLSVDVGAIIDGFYGDSARTYPVGEVTASGSGACSTRRWHRWRPASPSAFPATASTTSRMPCRRSPRVPDSRWCASMSGMASGAQMHEEPQVPNFGPAGKGPLLETGMVLRHRADDQRRRSWSALAGRRLDGRDRGRQAVGPFRAHGGHYRRRSVGTDGGVENCLDSRAQHCYTAHLRLDALDWRTPW